MILTRDQILQQRLPTETVEIPWIEGGQVRVRALPNHVVERAQQLRDGTHDEYVFVSAVVNEKGERLWKDDEAESVGETVERSLIELVVAAAYRLSVIPEERRAAIKKNWPTPDTGTSGESPSPSGSPTPTSSETS